MESENKITEEELNKILITQELESIKKRKTLYKYHAICGIFSWFLIQSAWVYYWVVYDVRAFAEMSFEMSTICVLSLTITILITSITHKKYVVLSNYEILIRKIEELEEKKRNLISKHF